MSAQQPAPAPGWRELDDEQLEQQYSPSSCVGGNITPFIEQYEIRSAEARERFDRHGPPLQEIRYGPAAAQTVDLVVPRSADGPVPLLVFIHGGYWQQLSKRESLFCAADFVDRGVAHAAVDYTLAPDATLDEIVGECHRAMAALRAQAAAAGVDPDRIVVAGSSAGAHLSAMVGLGAADGWRPAAVVLLSGVYELEPLLATTINDAVGLDRAAAQRNSPALAATAGFPPTLVAWGDNETEEFKLQSRAFGMRLQDSGSEVSMLEVAGRNHFDIVFDLGDPHSELGAATAALMESLERPRPAEPKDQD